MSWLYLAPPAAERGCGSPYLAASFMLSQCLEQVFSSRSYSLLLGRAVADILPANEDVKMRRK